MTVGFRKKLEALAKQKDCELVAKWQRGIINHLYWCIASTPDCNSDIIKAKWLSLEGHLHNRHKRHGNKHFPNCVHKKLVGAERNKKWFKRRKSLISLV